MTPAKDANKRITILKKDFSKMVKSVYDTQANIEIGVKDVPAPSAEEKELITKNVDLQINFLTDKDAKEAARLEATNQSADDINNEFLNGLGC
jgi:ADP-glucose pyrophosphorylase